MEQIEVRIAKLEMEMDILQKELQIMATEARNMKEELHLIQKTLNQIKYFAMGATAIYAGTATGLLKFITIL